MSLGMTIVCKRQLYSGVKATMQNKNTANETDEMIVCHVKLNNMFGYFMIVCLTYMLDIAFDWSQNVQSNGPP